MGKRGCIGKIGYFFPKFIHEISRGRHPRQTNKQTKLLEILKIYPSSGTDGRNLLLKVTDQELLDTTGGIVQGMSGSPILRDGKLVGADTHVLVNDPTRGYGMFIENMLDAAS